MQDEKIRPERVTKPIQLLAAWLVGLTVVDTAFPGSAVAIGSGEWERSALVLAAIVNVPLFLLAIFVLQTRFRPELQGDAFYFDYISRKTDAVVSVNKLDVLQDQITAIQKDLLTANPRASDASQSERGSDLDWSRWLIGLNDHRKDFTQIRAALREAAIPLAMSFGEEAPTKWIIAINQEMSFPYVRRLLRVLSKFEFDGFLFWHPVRDADETEDVYIGAYGGENYIPFDDDFKRILESDEFDEVDLHHLMNKKAREAA